MAATNEKYDDVAIQHDEHSKSEGEATPPQRELISYDPKEEKKLIRKIDGRLLPILGALYSIALIDRVNVCCSQTAVRPLTHTQADFCSPNLRHGGRSGALHWRSLHHCSGRLLPTLYAVCEFDT
jgi:hypothetical protein